ncbi:MAG: hypothetical protein JNG88_08405 [Phycisphaerales bacterium]|nr:hypothetical protein [Phycisphaerales bacterium]
MPIQEYWLWPVHPFDGEPNNRRHSDKAVKPGSTIDVVLRVDHHRMPGRRFGPHGREDIVHVSKRERRYYRPLLAEIDTVRAWNGDCDPKDPPWLRIRAVLRADGRLQAELAQATSSELVVMLGEMTTRRTGSTTGTDQTADATADARLSLRIRQLRGLIRGLSVATNGGRRIGNSVDAMSISEAVNEVYIAASRFARSHFDRVSRPLDGFPHGWQVMEADSLDGPATPVRTDAVTVSVAPIGPGGIAARVISILDRLARALGFSVDEWNRMQTARPGGAHYRFKASDVIPAEALLHLEQAVQVLEPEKHADQLEPRAPAPVSPLQRESGTQPREAVELRVSEAARLLTRDVPGLTLKHAMARVSHAANKKRFKTNGQKRQKRRIDHDSFAAWRLEQRDRDLDAHDREDTP